MRKSVKFFLIFAPLFPKVDLDLFDGKYKSIGS